MSYRRHVELRFSVCNEEFAIVYRGTDTMQIEETSKNGQEDTHMSGTLALRDGKWEWEDKSSRQSFITYGNDGVAAAIPAYINAYPPPELI